MVETSYTFGILTVSDRCSHGTAEDKSGPNLCRLVKEGLIPNGKVLYQDCVPDEEDKIIGVLKDWVDVKDVDVILTTGGTGFAPRDITPEATLKVIERQAPGLTFAMYKTCMEITPHAILSRAICGIRKQTIIVNLPGSSKGSRECFEAIAMSIPHAVALARNRQSAHAASYQTMKSPQAAPCHRHGSGRHHHFHAQQHVHHCCSHSHGDRNVASEVDISFVARRARESPYPMISVTDAQRIILTHVPVLAVQMVPLNSALGMVLARDVTAQDPLPPFPASLKDGYAAIAGDGNGFRVVISAAIAGNEPSEMLPLKSGQCMRINTGAPVPEGADCVVQVEDTELVKEGDGGRTELVINITKCPTVGLDIRPTGSDIATGQLVLTRSSELGPSELGLLATVGVVEVPVYRKPIVSVLSTGNELQNPSLPLAPGRIRDSNKTTLLALLSQHKYECVDAGIALDEPSSMLSKLQDALRRSDVVVTTGSVSMGERDMLKEVLSVDLSATIHFGRVNMKPGKPTTFATLMFEEQKKIVLGLPGNPVSAVVTAHLYLLPLLKKMCGHPSPLPTTIRATTDRDIKLDPRPEYHRSILTWSTNNPVPIGRSTGNQISSRLLSLSGANGLLVLPASSETCQTLPAGSEVNAIVMNFT